MILLVTAQLADLAAYLLVGRPDDSVLQAAGVDVPAWKLAGIALVVAILAVLQRGPGRSEAWALRSARLVALVGLLGAATGIRAVLA